MYQIGERVVYGVHGVCQILELQVQIVNRKKVEYYVLEPVRQPGARYFVPSQNQVAVSKLRPMLSKTEILDLLGSHRVKETVWIDDENQRRIYYKDLLTEGDRAGLLTMIRTLYVQTEQQAQLGKKCHMTDANFLKDAEKVLFSEFSMVLDIPYEKMVEYISQL